MSRLSTLVLFASCGLSASIAGPIIVDTDHADGLYRVGETVTWTVRASEPVPSGAVHYRILRGQITEVGRGDLVFKDGVASLPLPLEAPGGTLLEVTTQGADGKAVRVIGGVVASPEKIALSAPKPADFDAFWASKIEALRAVAPEVQLEPVAVAKTGVEYFKFTMNYHGGVKIRGQLARPAKPGKFPGLLIPQWAGIYGLDKSWVVDRAAEGWLVINIMPHDLPIDEPADFYKAQADGPLKNYWAIGNDDREESYFLRMYLSCVRAADYLVSRDDWDGKTLVAMGASQGGLQSLVVAGLHPKITAVVAEVPAGCDALGPVVGRRGGFPQWYDWVWDKDAAKVRETGRYFDVANFTPAIRCPVLVGIGLIDETCPPDGIYAALNQVNAPKEIVTFPKGGHQDEAGTHKAYNVRRDEAWLPALREGRAVAAAK